MEGTERVLEDAEDEEGNTCKGQGGGLRQGRLRQNGSNGRRY